MGHILNIWIKNSLIVAKKLKKLATSSEKTNGELTLGLPLPEHKHRTFEKWLNGATDHGFYADISKEKTIILRDIWHLGFEHARQEIVDITNWLKKNVPEAVIIDSHISYGGVFADYKYKNGKWVLYEWDKTISKEEFIIDT
jgi:hypothetical protein